VRSAEKKEIYIKDIWRRSVGASSNIDTANV